MVSDAVQSAALQTFLVAVELSNDPSKQDEARRKGRLAWELMHLHQIFRNFDFFKPNPDDPNPPVWPPIGPVPRHPFPIPDPVPWAHNPSLMAEIIRNLGDPNPQPDRPNVLTDHKLKLEAAKSLSASLQQSLKNLDELANGIVAPMFREK